MFITQPPGAGSLYAALFVCAGFHSSPGDGAYDAWVLLGSGAFFYNSLASLTITSGFGSLLTGHSLTHTPHPLQ
jgi:hypothetical protein